MVPGTGNEPATDQSPGTSAAARVTQDDLRQCLRIAGVTRTDQIGLAVLERSGRISVLRSDDEPGRWLLDDLPQGRRSST